MKSRGTCRKILMGRKRERRYCKNKREGHRKDDRFTKYQGLAALTNQRKNKK